MNTTQKAQFKKMQPLSISGILFGVGMGGLAYGIIFHQLAQAHNMISTRFFPDNIDNLQINMVWDGIFYMLTWVMIATGLALLWRVAKRGEVPLVTKFFAGSMVLGWGLFNLIEGILDHHILQLHHVVEAATSTNQILWDVAFLASGVILITVGTYIRRNSLQTIEMQRPIMDSLRAARI